MKPFSFLDAAEAEMNEAAAYYETQQEGLGRRFLAAIQDTVTRICIDPKLYSVVYGDARKCLARTFPYGVIFRERPGEIAIVAVMHLHRDPDYWRSR